MAASRPDWDAIRQGGRSLTYGELHRDVARLARALVDRGIRPGDRVGLLGNPSIELVLLDHAVVAIGAIPVGMFPDNPAKGAALEMQAIVDDADFAAFAFDASQAPLARQLRHRRAPIEIPAESIADMIAQHAPIDAWHRAAPDDIALVAYTGGTTGRPKGVMHCHRAIASWLSMTPVPGGIPDSRTVLFNIAHLSGQSTVWASAMIGACMVLFERYPATTEELVDLVEREQITILGLVAGTLRDIVQQPGIEQRRCGALKMISVGGAFISPQVLERASQLFPTTQVVNAYGLTESGLTISMLPVQMAIHKRERLSSVGRPAIMSLFKQTPFQVRIVDRDGRDVPAGELGEVAVRGVQMMVGYWNNPEETARAVRDGWLHTGDVGRLDGDGYLYLAGRNKDMIVTHDGMCIYSSEVEGVLEQHPAVREVAVVAAPVPDAGERVAAFAALRAGATLSLAELQQFCADQLAFNKIPSSLEVLPELPRTNVGKIDKAQLRKRCLAAP